MKHKWLNYILKNCMDFIYLQLLRVLGKRKSLRDFLTIYYDALFKCSTLELLTFISFVQNCQFFTEIIEQICSLHGGAQTSQPCASSTT